MIVFELVGYTLERSIGYWV
jgi:hypothetical protein